MLRHLGRAGRRRALLASYAYGLRHADLHVVEFPRSGGTWLAEMMRELLPPSADVRHGHPAHRATLRPAAHVLRDGRDAVVSLYYYHLLLRATTPPSRRHIDPFLADTLGPGADLDDVRGNLPAFIRGLRTRPHGGIMRPHSSRRFDTWPVQVRRWSAAPDVLTVRYEDLLTDAAAQLRRVADMLAVSSTDARLHQVAADHRFAATTGRQPGDADPLARKRKGVAGDWRAHFTAAAGAAFDDYAGSTLIEMGYEPDRVWLDRLPTS